MPEFCVYCCTTVEQALIEGACTRCAAFLHETQQSAREIACTLCGHREHTLSSANPPAGFVCLNGRDHLLAHETCARADHRYTQCPRCHQWHCGPQYDTREGTLCLSCVQTNRLSRCTRCEMLSISIDDTGICSSCRAIPPDQQSPAVAIAVAADQLYAYAYKPAPIFHPPKEEKNSKTRYLGVELEIHSGGENRQAGLKTIGSFFNTDLAYCKQDGSLDLCTGIEIVSHPCTLAFHGEKMPWEALFEALRKDGATSEENGQCGLHVHVARDSFLDSDHAYRLGVFVYNNFREGAIGEYPPINKLARRDPGFYCRSNRGLISGCIASNVEACHYHAVNYSNRATVELRCAAGTLEYAKFMAFLEFIDAAVEYTADAKIADLLARDSWQIFEAFVRNCETNERWAHLLAWIDGASN